MSNIDKQALREAAERAIHDDWGYDTDIFHEQVTPSVVLALLDELDKKQQYIKLRDQENEDIALTVGKLRVELEHYKSRESELQSWFWITRQAGMFSTRSWKPQNGE